MTDISCLIGTKVGNELSLLSKVDIRQVTLTTMPKSLDFLTFLHSKFGAGIKQAESYFSFVYNFNNSFVYISYFVAIFTLILLYGGVISYCLAVAAEIGKNRSCIVFGSNI